MQAEVALPQGKTKDIQWVLTKQLGVFPFSLVRPVYFPDLFSDEYCLTSL